MEEFKIGELIINMINKTAHYRGKSTLFTGSEFKVIECLIKNYKSGEYISFERLVNYVYAGCIDGGPLDALKCIHAFVYYIRARLRRLHEGANCLVGKYKYGYKLAIPFYSTKILSYGALRYDLVTDEIKLKDRELNKINTIERKLLKKIMQVSNRKAHQAFISEMNLARYVFECTEPVYIDIIKHIIRKFENMGIIFRRRNLGLSLAKERVVKEKLITLDPAKTSGGLRMVTLISNEKKGVVKVGDFFINTIKRKVYFKEQIICGILKHEMDLLILLANKFKTKEKLKNKEIQKILGYSRNKVRETVACFRIKFNKLTNYNIIEGSRHGYILKEPSKIIPFKKLKEKAAFIIQEYRRGGIYQKDLAKKYNCHLSSIGNLINGKVYKKISGGYAGS